MSSGPESEQTTPESPAPDQPPAPEGSPASAPPAADRPKKKKAKPKPPPPPSEEQIDSPNRQTIGLLSVIGVLTFFLWIFARGGCNYHPPKESRDPRKVELVDLARDPKDAAMEFELRLATKRFAGALELAKGPLVEMVRGFQKECDADANCAQQAATLRGKVQVTAQLLERDPYHSTSRVFTYGVGPTPEKHIIKVERDGQIWKTVSRDTDDGSFKPKVQPQIVGGGREGSMILRQPGMPGMDTPGANQSTK